MEVKTKDIMVYYLNPDSFHERRETMEKRLTELDLNYERSPSNSPSEHRHIRINDGLISLCLEGMHKGIYPFLILEDDALNVNPLPEKFNMPDEARLIYWGASIYNCGGKKKNLYIEDYDKDYYRLYHSLGTHAVLIPNKESGTYFINKNFTANGNNDFSDIYLAMDQENEIVLTPKDGVYFCQADKHTRPVTDFSWKDKQSLIKKAPG